MGRDNEIDKQLKTLGWTYDAGEEAFLAADGSQIEWEGLEVLLDAVPDLTLNELTAYQERKWVARAA